jgi:hypothetical protein
LGEHNHRDCLDRWTDARLRPHGIILLPTGCQVQGVSCARPFPSFAHVYCHSGTQKVVETLMPIPLQIQEKIHSKKKLETTRRSCRTNIREPHRLKRLPLPLEIISSSLARLNILLYNFCPRVLLDVSDRVLRNAICRGGAIPRPGPSSIKRIDPLRQGWQGLVLCVFLSPILLPQKHARPSRPSRPSHPSSAITGSPLGRIHPALIVWRWRVWSGRGGPWFRVRLHGWCRHPIGR